MVYNRHLMIMSSFRIIPKRRLRESNGSRYLEVYQDVYVTTNGNASHPWNSRTMRDIQDAIEEKYGLKITHINESFFDFEKLD